MNPLKIIIIKLACLSLLLLIAPLSTSVYALGGLEEVNVFDGEPKKNTVYFPQFQLFETVKNEAEMSDEISGRLDLDNECLRVVTKQGSFLIVWPGWYDFTVSDREIVVNKINTGTAIAHLKIGDRISFSGAELVYYPVALQFKIPDQCLGPFWAVGEIQSVKTEVPVTKESLPVPKKPQKISKDVTKSAKTVMPPKKQFQQQIKEPAESGKQLKKLEIMLEKTMLK